MRQSMLAGLVATALLGACGRSTKELSVMNDDQLLHELAVARFQTVGFGGYDKQVRQVIVDKHPEWSAGVRAAVADGRVSLGMNKLQVGASWGSPTHVSSSLRSDGEWVTWRYDAPQLGDGMLPTRAAEGPAKYVHFGPSGLVTGVDQ